MSIDVRCDRCKREFLAMNDTVYTFRLCSVSRQEAAHMEFDGALYPYECDFHLCGECFDVVERVITGEVC